VNRKLSAHIQRLSGDATFNKSSYGAEKDFELVVWKTDILASQIDAMLEVYLCRPNLAVFPVEAQPCSLALSGPISKSCAGISISTTGYMHKVLLHWAVTNQSAKCRILIGRCERDALFLWIRKGGFRSSL
jgi:hypothetical protein